MESVARKPSPEGSMMTAESELQPDMLESTHYFKDDVSSPREPTDETSEYYSSAEVSSVDQGHYEVVEYDLDDGHILNGEALLAELDALNIQDDSPAAAALRANAQVKVSTMGKAARAVHMQAVRKFVKRATGTTKNGVIKGKPPRIPPPQNALHAPRPLETIDEGQEPVRTSNLDYYGGSTISSPSAQAAVDAAAGLDLPDDVVPGTVEAGKKVLGAVDPHDLLRLLRWRRRKNGFQKQPKSYVKGKVIDGEHELYTLSIAVMIGVRTSISRTNAELTGGPDHRWVHSQDFTATEKYEFRPKGGNNKGGVVSPPHQLSHTFKFKDYSPIAFAYLRRMYGVNEFDFLLSVCGNANFIEFISNAKSGQFFFYSSDGRYMIKTMTNAESKFLRRILPQYFRHCAENPNTMITRFFGMYRVKLYHLRRNVKFVIMNSVFYTDKYLQSFYDLKGSSVGREAKPEHAVKKDNDLRKLLPDEAFALSPNVRAGVRNQLEKDCDFLREMGILDYSMLIGIHYVPPKDDSRASHDNSPWRSTASSKTEEGSESSDSAPPATITVENGGIVTSLSMDSAGGIRRLNNEQMNRHQLSETIGAFFDGLDDDDNSYLMGTESRPHMHAAFSADTERKKQATIEKLYWPFHRWFDIHGHRRFVPITCAKCSHKPCCCDDKNPILKGYKIPKFVTPLSQRKDGGFEMDTTGVKLPMVQKGPNGDQPYFGKIFYMGIIDVLQEYTSRKVIEAQYRMFQTNGKLEASCVPPKDYSQRFVEFFDEYTQKPPQHEEEGVELSLEFGVGENRAEL